MVWQRHAAFKCDRGHTHTHTHRRMHRHIHTRARKHTDTDTLTTTPHTHSHTHTHTMCARFVLQVKNAVHCTDLAEDTALELEYVFSILA